MTERSRSGRALPERDDNDPGAASLARDEPRLAQKTQVVRHGRLIERKRVGEIADAHVVLGSIEGGEDGQPVRIAQSLEELGLGAKRPRGGSGRVGSTVASTLFDAIN